MFVVESNNEGIVEEATTGLDVVELVVLTTDDVVIVVVDDDVVTAVERVEDLVVENASGPTMLMIIVFWKEANVPVSG